MNWNLITEIKTDESRQEQKRNDFERDHDRIVFSSAFRRLNQKTQVFPMPVNYFVHNRMTHSLETSCIGRSLGKNVAKKIVEKYKLPDEILFTQIIGSIVEAACLAHDIGNPPFGHSGEDAISSFFVNNKNLIKSFSKKEQYDLCNFEGNAQGFRLLTEKKSDLELTQNVVMVFTKYPKEGIVKDYINDVDIDRKDQKKYGVFQNEKQLFNSIAEYFELRKLSKKEIAYARHPLSYLVEAADDICYLPIDIEDGVRLGQISLKDIEDILIPIIQENNRLSNLFSVNFI